MGEPCAVPLIIAVAVEDQADPANKNDDPISAKIKLFFFHKQHPF